jgi:hypothetical protein
MEGDDCAPGRQLFCRAAVAPVLCRAAVVGAGAVCVPSWWGDLGDCGDRTRQRSGGSFVRSWSLADGEETGSVQRKDGHRAGTLKRGKRLNRSSLTARGTTLTGPDGEGDADYHPP